MRCRRAQDRSTRHDGAMTGDARPGPRSGATATSSGSGRPGTVSVFGSLVTRTALPFAAILVLGAGPLEIAILRSLQLVRRARRRAVRRRLGRPPAPTADHDRRRPRPGRAARLDPGRGHRRRPAHRAALSRVVPRGDPDARSSTSPTGPTCRRWSKPDQLVAGEQRPDRQRVGRRVLGVRDQRLPHPAVQRADRDRRRRGVVPGLGPVPRLDPAARAAPATGRRPRAGRSARSGTGSGSSAGSPILRAIAGAGAASHVLWGVFGTSYLLFATRTVGLGPAAIGVIAGLGGAGRFVGAVLGRARRVASGRPDDARRDDRVHDRHRPHPARAVRGAGHRGGLPHRPAARRRQRRRPSTRSAQVSLTQSVVEDRLARPGQRHDPLLRGPVPARRDDRRGLIAELLGLRAAMAVRRPRRGRRGRLPVVLADPRDCVPSRSARLPGGVLPGRRDPADRVGLRRTAPPRTPSGSNGRRSPTFSPTPTKRTGTLSASSMAKTIPPFEVESSLVRTTPVSPTASWKATAWARPFWPVVASSTNSVSGPGARAAACRRSGGPWPARPSG